MARKKRLLWQLYPSYLLIIIVSLVAVTWYASRSLRNFFLEQTATDLEAKAHIFEQQILEHLDPPDVNSIDQMCKNIGARSSTRITVLLPSGKVIGDSEGVPASMDSHADRPEILQALTGRSGMSIRYSRTLEQDMMYVAIPTKKGEQTVAIIRTSIPVTSIDDALKDIQIKIAFGGLIISLFAAILCLLISRRISRPLEDMKQGSEHFARGELEYRLSVPDSEEMRSLAEAMNYMAVQLDDRIKTVVKQRNELKAVLSSMVEGVIAVDMDERIINMNHAAAQMLKTTPSEAQGRSIQEVARNTALLRFVANALSSQDAFEEDIELYSDGKRILNGHGTVLHDAEGHRIGALIVLNDVTRLRKLENIRREFVANVSHEIKTPITAISGFVETLHAGSIKDPKDTERFLAIIMKHVNRLNTIIEDLLSLSRIEEKAEKEEVVLAVGRVKDVLQTAIQLCEVKAASKRINLELSCNEDIVAEINHPLLEQAVVNLLDNAIKYSNNGSAIQIKAEQTDDETIISVSDQGCGIDKEHLSRLFERFYRVDKARSRKLGGTGLGLAIVKHIVQAHRGRVSVESTPEEGSVFTIYLPKD
jgi:two-component system phosphate regulon sensor histidine kinase PhoR